MPFDHAPISRRKTLGLLASASAAPMFPAAVKALENQNLPTITNGINIPLWMDQPDGSASPPSGSVLSLLKQFGFDTVRLPVDPDRFAGSTTQILNASRDLTAVLNTLIGFDFSVTVDMHPQGAISQALKRDSLGDDALNTAWQNISNVTAGFSNQSVFLELLNEPQMWRDRWLPLRDRLAETVRRNCPEHTIIWGANKWQSIQETITCPLLPDENAIVAVHYYLPMPFTHQCANWGEEQNSLLKNLPFPATLNSPQIGSVLSQIEGNALNQFMDDFGQGWSVKKIADDFAQLKNWSDAQGTKTILNEFASLKFCSDSPSRAIWTRAVRQAAETNNIGWAYWEFDRGFGFMGSRTSLADIELDLVAALVGGAL